MVKCTAFFTKHRRLVSFTGALIVFITFIVKDALREHVKDIVDSQAVAETTYYLDSDINETHIDLSDILQQIKDTAPGGIADRTKLEKSSLRSNRPSVIRDQLYTEIKEGFERESILEENESNALDSMGVLVDTLPSNDSNRQQMDKLENSFSQLEASEKALDEMLSHPSYNWKVEIDENAIIAEELDTLTQQTNNFARNVLLEFINLSNNEKNLYKKYTWASYILYAIGWSLALVGRFMGSNEQKDDGL
jgi:hypothetical protein